jgi:hypothetical protein
MAEGALPWAVPGYINPAVKHCSPLVHSPLLLPPPASNSSPASQFTLHFLLFFLLSRFLCVRQLIKLVRRSLLEKQGTCKLRSEHASCMHGSLYCTRSPSPPWPSHLAFVFLASARRHSRGLPLATDSNWHSVLCI